MKLCVLNISIIAFLLSSCRDVRVVHEQPIIHVGVKKDFKAEEEASLEQLDAHFTDIDARTQYVVDFQKAVVAEKDTLDVAYESLSHKDLGDPGREIKIADSKEYHDFVEASEKLLDKIDAEDIDDKISEIKKASSEASNEEKKLVDSIKVRKRVKDIKSRSRLARTAKKSIDAIGNDLQKKQANLKRKVDSAAQKFPILRGARKADALDDVYAKIDPAQSLESLRKNVLEDKRFFSLLAEVLAVPTWGPMIEEYYVDDLPARAALVAEEVERIINAAKAEKKKIDDIFAPGAPALTSQAEIDALARALDALLGTTDFQAYTITRGVNRVEVLRRVAINGLMNPVATSLAPPPPPPPPGAGMPFAPLLPKKPEPNPSQIIKSYKEEIAKIADKKPDDVSKKIEAQINGTPTKNGLADIYDMAKTAALLAIVRGAKNPLSPRYQPTAENLRFAAVPFTLDGLRIALEKGGLVDGSENEAEFFRTVIRVLAPRLNAALFAKILNHINKRIDERLAFLRNQIENSPTIQLIETAFAGFTPPVAHNLLDIPTVIDEKTKFDKAQDDFDNKRTLVAPIKVKILQDFEKQRDDDAAEFKRQCAVAKGLIKPLLKGKIGCKSFALVIENYHNTVAQKGAPGFFWRTTAFNLAINGGKGVNGVRNSFVKEFSRMNDSAKKNSEKFLINRKSVDYDIPSGVTDLRRAVKEFNDRFLDAAAAIDLSAMPTTHEYNNQIFIKEIVAILKSEPLGPSKWRTTYADAVSSYYNEFYDSMTAGEIAAIKTNVALGSRHPLEKLHLVLTPEGLLEITAPFNTPTDVVLIANLKKAALGHINNAGNEGDGFQDFEDAIRAVDDAIDDVGSRAAIATLAKFFSDALPHNFKKRVADIAALVGIDHSKDFSLTGQLGVLKDAVEHHPNYIKLKDLANLATKPTEEVDILGMGLVAQAKALSPALSVAIFQSPADSTRIGFLFGDLQKALKKSIEVLKAEALSPGSAAKLGHNDIQPMVNAFNFLYAYPLAELNKLAFNGTDDAQIARVYKRMDLSYAEKFTRLKSGVHKLHMVTRKVRETFKIIGYQRKKISKKTGLPKVVGGLKGKLDTATSASPETDALKKMIREFLL